MRKGRLYADRARYSVVGLPGRVFVEDDSQADVNLAQRNVECFVPVDAGDVEPLKVFDETPVVGIGRLQSIR